MIPDFSAPKILFYPLESVIAEKFQAIVYLGFATSRMKDFYDILFLAENNSFTLKNLKKALDATFAQRETELESRFFMYEKDFVGAKERLWKLFIKKIGSDKPFDFSLIIERINKFLEPVITAKEGKENLIWGSEIWNWRQAKKL